MNAALWKTARRNSGMAQVAAARSLGVSQPYLSHLERGLRVPTTELTFKAAKLYGLPTELPLPATTLKVYDPDELYKKLGSLHYPGFKHVRAEAPDNPAEVVLGALLKPSLDTRLVEALPWVLGAYTDLNWSWLRDRAKLNNAQNRLGYVVHLAEQTSSNTEAVWVLAGWKGELEEARLAHEGTLCRDSMSEPERKWVRANRPEAAVHWNLLTTLRAEQLPYVAKH